MSAEPVAGAVVTGGLSGPGVSPPSLSGAGRRFLSDILVELGFVDEAVAAQAVDAARRPGMTRIDGAITTIMALGAAQTYAPPPALDVRAMIA